MHGLYLHIIDLLVSHQTSLCPSFLVASLLVLQGHPQHHLRMPRCLHRVPGRLVPPATVALSAALHLHLALQVRPFCFHSFCIPRKRPQGVLAQCFQECCPRQKCVCGPELGGSSPVSSAVGSGGWCAWDCAEEKWICSTCCHSWHPDLWGRKPQQEYTLPERAGVKFVLTHC